MNTEPTDTQRMDWFSHGPGRSLSQCEDGEWCARFYFGDTPRSAIDAAIAAEKTDKADSTF